MAGTDRTVERQPLAVHIAQNELVTLAFWILSIFHSGQNVMLRWAHNCSQLFGWTACTLFLSGLSSPFLHRGPANRKHAHFGSKQTSTRL